MTTPLVSVCIPTYNGAHFIGDTIRSVLEQTHKNLEILVFDDGSTDDTQTIVEGFDDNRLKYFRNAKNLGPKGNWDQCLARATGKYYKLLPHDDLLPSDTVAAQVEILEKDQDRIIALVFGQREVITSSGKILMARKPLGKNSRKISAKQLINRCVASGGNIIGEPGNGLIRREVLDQVGPYDDSHPYTIDMNFWFRILQYGCGYYMAQVTSSFRVHPHAWTSEIGQNQHRDYMGTVQNFSKNPNYDISDKSKKLGAIRAVINTKIRQFVYRVHVK